MVIDDILQESTEYYLGRKTQAIGAILLTPPGSPCLRRRGGQGYWYLRRYAGGNRRNEAYLGREDAPGLQPRLERVRQRKQRIASLKQDKLALRKLGVKKMQVERENFQPVIKDLFKALEEEGLWELGFEIVGSWCFIIYQNYCGVEPYPLRTLDVDIAVSLPYRSEKKDVGGLLKSLGFAEQFNRADGSISYDSGEIRVEFLSQRKGSGAREVAPQVPELGIAPVAIPYLNLLLDRPMQVKVHGVARVTVPEMSAFMLHKLLVAAIRKEAAKSEKDYRQVLAVAKTVAMDESHLEMARQIIREIPEGWLKRMRASLKKMSRILGPEAAPALDLLEELLATA